MRPLMLMLFPFTFNVLDDVHVGISVVSPFTWIQLRICTGCMCGAANFVP